MDAPIDHFAGVKNIDKHVGSHSARPMSLLSNTSFFSRCRGEGFGFDRLDPSKACQKYTNIYDI